MLISIAIIVVGFLLGMYVSESRYSDDPRPRKPGDAVVDLDPNGDMAYYSKDLDIRYGKVKDFRD